MKKIILIIFLNCNTFTMCEEINNDLISCPSSGRDDYCESTFCNLIACYLSRKINSETAEQVRNNINLSVERMKYSINPCTKKPASKESVLKFLSKNKMNKKTIDFFKNIVFNKDAKITEDMKINYNIEKNSNWWDELKKNFSPFDFFT